MTAEENINSSQKRPFHLLPGLVILGALLLYGITLNHWVTSSSLSVIAKITGWDWHPLPLSWRQTPVAPLFLVLTCPIRILPVAWQPVALNAFAAVCAALTLGLLAASVRLLPHDRTREQRQREGGEFSLLSLPSAFLPIIFAVVMLALQLTFWRNAIAATGEMLDVLVFAALIFCLLKFRISQNDDWLAAFAFLYGLGTANNWALIGFFPFFFVALIWIKGVNFFNVRFLARIAGCGSLGLLLYLLVPAMSSLGSERANFFSMLHLELGAQNFGLRLVPRWIVLVAALPTLLPLFFAGIRWPSFEGELSAAGSAMTKYMFRMLHVVFLLLALVMFFNLKFSPSLRLQEMPMVGFLTFYYAGALCIGYYSGYILLVFGKGTSLQAWEKRGPLARAFNLLIVGLLWVVAVVAAGGICYQNIPHINTDKSNALVDFSREIMQDLPNKSVIILSDDPSRSYLLDAIFRREGKPNSNVMIETASLPHREYIAYLISRYPELKKVTTSSNLPPVLPRASLVDYLYQLNKNFSIYYLHPSFGYYFEAFYLKPHGLVYELQTYPKNVIEPPLPDSQEIKENQDIWAKLDKKVLATFPSQTKLNPDALLVSSYLSVALNWWGVALQKAGHLQEANAKFAEAMQINPQNFIAKINREYNERLQKNDHRPIDTKELIYKAINLYQGMPSMLKYNGPVDEPGLNLEFGSMMAEGRDFRQAAILFKRRLQLMPGDVGSELDLAKTFVDSGGGGPDKAIELIRKLRANPAANRWEVARVEALAYFAKNDFPTAEKLMVSALQEDPQDANRIAILAEFYRVTAYTALRQTNKIEATRRFNNALTYFDQQLQLATAASHKSDDSSAIADTLLKKAEIQMMLKTFEAGITTLNKVMELQPKNQTALLNRAIAEVQLKQYQAAKDDFKALRKLLPEHTYMADFGLADIASREKNNAEEIRCLKRYLSTAPDNVPEYQQVKQRLKKLEGP